MNLSTILGQSTTGNGVAVLLASTTALCTGQLSLEAAIPTMLGAICLIAWPQKTAVAAETKAIATDVMPLFEPLLQAYLLGHQHAAASIAPPSTATPGAPTPPATPTPATAPSVLPTASAAVALLACGLSLSACGGTAQQQAAELRAAQSGVVCLMDQEGKLVAAASATDTIKQKALASAAVAGNALLTDGNCQQAVIDAAALALPTPPAPAPAP